jgi:hypothetical protein
MSYAIFKITATSGETVTGHVFGSGGLIQNGLDGLRRLRAVSKKGTSPSIHMKDGCVKVHDPVTTTAEGFGKCTMVPIKGATIEHVKPCPNCGVDELTGPPTLGCSCLERANLEPPIHCLECGRDWNQRRDGMDIDLDCYDCRSWDYETESPDY